MKAKGGDRKEKRYRKKDERRYVEKVFREKRHHSKKSGKICS